MPSLQPTVAKTSCDTGIEPSVGDESTMPSSQPTVAKTSCDTELEPSVGCDSGIVDSSLNEAPHNHTFHAASYRPVHPLSSCIFCGVRLGELRDGQLG